MREADNMRKSKILQICAIDQTAGSLLRPLIEKSVKEGYEVHVACTNTGKLQALQAEGFHMIDIPIDRSIHPVRNIKTIMLLYKLMKQEQYDIVHVHTPVAALLGRIAAKMARIKNVIYTAHGFYFHEGMSKKQYRLFFEIEKLAARWLTDWLLLQSIEDYMLAIEERFKKMDRIIHLSNGVDIWKKFNVTNISVSDKDKIKKDIGINEEDVVFTFIGRLVREKGIFELVEAFKIASEGNKKIKLLLIGDLLNSERDQKSYSELMEELQHPQITPLGFRADISLLMSITDVFVLPSHREGLPRSIIEAMAMGKPIIATNIRGCREQVFPNKNGLLVEKENTDQLSIAIIKMAENQALRAKFSRESRKLAEDLFDEQKVLEKQITIFNKLTLKNAIKEENQKRGIVH